MPWNGSLLTDSCPLTVFFMVRIFFIDIKLHFFFVFSFRLITSSFVYDISKEWCKFSFFKYFNANSHLSYRFLHYSYFVLILCAPFPSLFLSSCMSDCLCLSNFHLPWMYVLFPCLLVLSSLPLPFLASSSPLSSFHPLSCLLPSLFLSLLSFHPLFWSSILSHFPFSSPFIFLLPLLSFFPSPSTHLFILLLFLFCLLPFPHFCLSLFPFPLSSDSSSFFFSFSLLSLSNHLFILPPSVSPPFPFFHLSHFPFHSPLCPPPVSLMLPALFSSSFLYPLYPSTSSFSLYLLFVSSPFRILKLKTRLAFACLWKVCSSN